MKTKALPFHKMSAAGNDFIVIDESKGLPYAKLAKQICHRYDGICADGVLVFGKSRKADFRMRIFNADGSEAEMCGNGARCMAKYIAHIKRISKGPFTLETMAGIIHCLLKKNSITITLPDPKDYQPDITLTINKRPIRLSYIDTGVPHAVIFVDGLKNIAVNVIAPQIRYHRRFKPRGTNVNFVEQINRQMIAVRTYERGVEAETRACGTGSVASAIVSYLKANPHQKIINSGKMCVQTASGEVLTVSFSCHNGVISHVTLTGTAKIIARGEIFYG